MNTQLRHTRLLIALMLAGAGCSGSAASMKLNTAGSGKDSVKAKALGAPT